MSTSSTIEDWVRMSLMKIAEERDDCNPMEGLEGGRERSTRKRGEEAEGRKEGNEEKDEKEDEEKDEDELEDWKREGREARVCYPGVGVNQLAGEEMMEGMERVRKNRPGRGMSIILPCYVFCTCTLTYRNPNMNKFS